MKYVLLLVCLLITIHSFAQDKKAKEDEKVPVYNYTIREDPMDAFHQMGEREYKYFPEFYSFSSSKVKDTTYKFECYDSRDSILSLNKIQDIKDVRFISLFKSYIDPVHTYKDADGKEKPLPVSSIIRRYDRAGDYKWLSIDYKNNKYTELKEYRTNIVRTDTVLVEDPVAHKEYATIYCYYKVETIKK